MLAVVNVSIGNQLSCGEFRTQISIMNPISIVLCITAAKSPLFES